jgi:hypothetical protein
MAYNPAIPNAPDKPKNSQPQLKDNFTGIKTLIDINHVTFDLADQGKHAKVTMPVQTAAPVVLAGEGCIYNKNFATTGKNETYLHNQLIASTVDIPMSASVLSNTVPVMNSNGWTYLPSGIILRWETQALVAGAQTITLAVIAGSPAFTNIFQVMLTPATINLSVQLTGILNNTQFTVNSSGIGSMRVLTIGN